MRKLDDFRASSGAVLKCKNCWWRSLSAYTLRLWFSGSALICFRSGKYCTDIKENSLLFHGNDAPAARDLLCVDSSVRTLDIFHVADLDVFVLDLFWFIFGVLVKFRPVRLDNVDFLYFFQRNALVLPDSVRLSIHGLSVGYGKIVGRGWLRGLLWNTFLLLYVKFISGIDSIAVVANRNQHLYKFVVVSDDLWRHFWNLLLCTTELGQLVVCLHNVCRVISVHKGGTDTVRPVLRSRILRHAIVL